MPPGPDDVHLSRTGQRLSTVGDFVGRKRLGATAHLNLPTAALPASGSRGLRATSRRTLSRPPRSPRQEWAPPFPVTSVSLRADTICPPIAIRMRRSMVRKTEQPFLPFDEPAPRPEPPPEAARLISALAAACAEAPLSEKVLVAPSLLAGHTLVERLAREGHPWTNLRVETVRTLALAEAGPALAREGLRLLSRAQALALVEQACAQALGPRSYFGALRERTGLHRAIQRTLDELRAAGIGPGRLPTAAFTDRRKASELRRVLAGYDDALAKGRFVDSLGVLTRAAAMDPPSDASTVYLLPSDAELSELDRLVLERLAGDRLRSLPVDEPGTWTARASSAELVRAIGEENEIREVFRRCLAGAVPFDDVEILHTDERVYPALAWELSREHGIPCTFARGVPVTYSRPGQAALAFLAWIAEGFAADRLREALASGAASLRRLGGSADAPPGGMVAREIRRARIGWGRRRHLTALDRHVRELEGPERRSRRTRRPKTDLRRSAPPCASGASPPRAWRAPSPRARWSSRRRKARANRCRPSPARRRVRLRIRARHRRSRRLPLARPSRPSFARSPSSLPLAASAGDALERLRDAVGELAVLADRPRPGRVHVSGFAAGGHSGRGHTFPPGARRDAPPGARSRGPRSPRRRAREGSTRPWSGPFSPIERERPARAGARPPVVRRAAARTAHRELLEFDLRNLSQSGEPAPSPFFLELYRAKTGTNADYGDMLADPAPSGGLRPRRRFGARRERVVARPARRGRGGAPGGGAGGSPAVSVAGRRARRAGRTGERRFHALGRTPGGSRAGAGPAPAAAPTSASLVQSLAGCPFSYFLRNVLRIRPPDDLERDSTRWLEPLDEGSLLHEVFRAFLEDLTRRGEKPDARRHAEALFALCRRAHRGMARARAALERGRVPVAARNSSCMPAGFPGRGDRALPRRHAALVRGRLRHARRGRRRHRQRGAGGNSRSDAASA